jgi:protein dithiol oxidoreductase (disulfide-forming)
MRQSRFRRTLLVALLAATSVGAAAATSESLPGGHWKVGVNYDPIVPAQPTAAPRGKIEVLEVFWLGCPHCYALEPYIRNWLKGKPSYVDFVRVPVMWGPAHRLHAQLFYTLEALHRDDLVEKAFDTIHQDNNPLIGTDKLGSAIDEQDTFSKQLDWAKSNGIDPTAFTTAYNSLGVKTELQHAQDITDRYHVEGVPFVAVGGKYSTDVGKAGGHEQLIQLIDDLAAFDRQHRSHRA